MWCTQVLSNWSTAPAGSLTVKVPSYQLWSMSPGLVTVVLVVVAGDTKIWQLGPVTTLGVSALAEPARASGLTRAAAVARPRTIFFHGVPLCCSCVSGQGPEVPVTQSRSNDRLRVKRRGHRVMTAFVEM